MSRLNVVFAIALMVCLFVLGIFISRLLPLPAAQPQIINTASVIRQIQTLSQLVTVKYVIEKVVVLEDAKWYGDSRVTIVAHGIVKAGTELDKIQPGDVRIVEKTISFTIPKAGITDAYLDDKQTQILERSTGLMRTFDKDLEQNARRQAVDEVKRAAFRGGIMTEADQRAREQLIQLCKAMGFEKVEVQSK